MIFFEIVSVERWSSPAAATPTTALCTAHCACSVVRIMHTPTPHAHTDAHDRTRRNGLHDWRKRRDAARRATPTTTYTTRLQLQGRGPPLGGGGGARSRPHDADRAVARHLHDEAPVEEEGLGAAQRRRLVRSRPVPAGGQRVGLYKICIYFEACVHGSIILLLPPPHLHCPRDCNTIAQLFAQYTPPPYDHPSVYHTPYNISNGNIV